MKYRGAGMPFQKLWPARISKQVNLVNCQQNPRSLSPLRCQDVAVHLKKLHPSGSPIDLVHSAQRRCAQPFQKRPIFMQHGDVLREGLNVSDPMHKPSLHVPANFGAGFRCECDTSAPHRFRDYKTESLFDAGKHYNVTFSHQPRSHLQLS
jgi:hypothetical protein